MSLEGAMIMAAINSRARNALAANLVVADQDQNLAAGDLTNANVRAILNYFRNQGNAKILEDVSLEQVFTSILEFGKGEPLLPAATPPKPVPCVPTPEPAPGGNDPPKD